jgi:hypothetical protein
MKRAWSVIALVTAACATTPKEPATVIRPHSEPNTFDVEESGKESTERRYTVKCEEFMSGEEEPPRTHVPEGVLPADDRHAAMAMHIAGIVRHLIEPDSWNRDPRRAVFVDRNQLVVRHAPEALERIDRLILTLKAHRANLVRFTMREFPIPPGGDVQIEGLVRAEGGLAGVFDRDDLAHLIRAGRPPHQEYRGELPRITVWAGQAGQLYTRDSLPFIEGLKRAADGWDPQIGVLETGTTINVRGIPLGPESDTVLIEVSAGVRSLKAMRLLELAAGTIQLPEVAESGASGLFVVKPGQALLLLPYAAAGSTGPPAALLVEPKLVKPTD